MAARFWRGTTSTSWGDVNNWSATSGGATGASVPIATDDITFDSAGNNPCDTLNAVRPGLSLTVASGYTSTITISSGGTLTISGSITFHTGFTLTNSGNGIRMIAAGTWTSNGYTVTSNVEIGGTTAFTCTLADALNITGTLLLSNTTSTTFSGAFDITVSGNATISGSQIITLSGNVIIGGSTSLASGTPDQIDGAFLWKTAGLSIGSGITLQGSATVVLTGGTWTTNNTVMTINLTIDAGANTVTINGTNLYSTGTITYTSGTVVHSSTLSINASTTLNTNGMGWNNITLTVALTLTLNSLLTVSGTLTMPNAAVTFAGSAGWTVATWANTNLSISRIWTFLAGATYTITSAWATSLGNNSAIRLSLVSSTPGTAVHFVLAPLATQDVGFVDPTDIDASLGQMIFTYHGTVTTSPNWTAIYPLLRRDTVRRAGWRGIRSRRVLAPGV